MSPATHRERLIDSVAQLLEGANHIAVGASSPIPAAAGMLLRARREVRGDRPVLLSILGSVEHNFFTNGGTELFDCAAQGRIDAFFLGGGQIDGQANVNLVGTGDYGRPSVRWPGSFGSSFLYFVVPRVILFREEHTRRVLVDRVDFVSAPGVSPPGVCRRGGPHALVTGLALFSFDRERARFRLRSTHAGQSVEEIRAVTGFDFDAPERVPPTPDPDAATLSLLRGRIRGELAETYPHFAALMSAALQAGAGPAVD